MLRPLLPLLSKMTWPDSAGHCSSEQVRPRTRQMALSGWSLFRSAQKTEPDCLNSTDSKSSSGSARG
jgi:hypothetical protein